jgi:hypothetical protein
VTSILVNSKVTITHPHIWFRPTTHLHELIFTNTGSPGAIVNHVTTQCQDQGRLLEETKRDLDVFKKAYYKAEREIREHEERFEQEKRTLNDEIIQLKVRHFPQFPMRSRRREFQVFSLHIDLVYDDAVMLTVPPPPPPPFRESRLVKNEWWC